MADSEHFAMLNKGVEAWNTWRKKYPEVQPDLRGATLPNIRLIGADFSDVRAARANFVGKDLSGANFRGATLKEADFREAILQRVVLNKADLENAKLNRAYLGGSSLRKADLRKADLRWADLRAANLMLAELEGSQFRGTILWDTLFVGNDLSKVKGLEYCQHNGPSFVDYQTLMRSGPLPGDFLKGCGLPAIWINKLPILRGDPRTFYTCFISFASEDQAFVERLHTDLQSQGVRCWFAPKDMKIGEKIRTAIDQAIRGHERFLLILSEFSVSSQWVEQEVEKALEKERIEGRLMLFPICLDPVIFEMDTGWASFLKNSRHIGDFTRWEDPGAYQEALKRLLRDLQAERVSFKPRGGRV